MSWGQCHWVDLYFGGFTCISAEPGEPCDPKRGDVQDTGADDAVNEGRAAEANNEATGNAMNDGGVDGRVDCRRNGGGGAGPGRGVT